MRFNRRYTAWLAILAALIGVAVVAGTGASPAVLAALFGLYAAALGLSVLQGQPNLLRRSLPASPLAMMRMSAPAREAADRARRRTGYSPPGFTLMDIGVIALIRGEDGDVLWRRGRSVSLDDDGVRPYISLNVEPQQSDRSATVRFEILDQGGDVQFIHEMKTYLRPGETNLIPDHLLPLAGNDRLKGAGDWDLRVSLDGVLLGMLGFTTTPSLRERRQNLMRSQPGATRLQDEQEDSPVPLEELLRQPPRENKGRG